MSSSIARSIRRCGASWRSRGASDSVGTITRVTTFADRIAVIDARVRDRSMTADAAIAELAAGAQVRGGPDGRRADGAFFTDDDVALHLARRAIGAVLLEAAGADHARVDDHLAAGDDLVALVLEAAREGRARARIVDRLGGLVVLDPTCGAGAFLHAAWSVLVTLDDALAATVVRASQLHGLDVDADAARACEVSLALATAGRTGRASIRVADAESAGAMPAADVVLGNPPYVRAAPDERHADLATRGVPNRSAWIVERALAAARPAARVSFVLPVSTACTDAFGPARASWERACSTVVTSHFDTIPATLFDGVVQRLSIFEGRRRSSVAERAPARWFTSRYHRWLREERAGLLDRVRHVPLPTQTVSGSIAKVGDPIEAQLLERLFAHPPAGRLFAAPSAGAGRVLYKRRWSYFLLFTDFVPELWDSDGVLREPSELKSIHTADPVDAAVLLAACSSTLFWWYFSVFTDNRNVNRRDLAAFPLPELDAGSRAQLASLAGELMVALRGCAEVRTCTYRSIGTIRNTYFRQGATRPVIDRIDAALAEAYGMSDAELEFVLGFERRFRS